MGLAPGLTSDVYIFTATLDVCLKLACPPKVGKATWVSGEMGLAPGLTSDVYTFTATLDVCLWHACPPKVSEAGLVSGGDGTGSWIDI